MNGVGAAFGRPFLYPSQFQEERQQEEISEAAYQTISQTKHVMPVKGN
jgi:hypothetical protein